MAATLREVGGPPKMVPVSGTAYWEEAIPATALDGADTGGPNPDAVTFQNSGTLALRTVSFAKENGMGITNLILCLAGTGTITASQIRVLGRTVVYDGTGAVRRATHWQTLRNKNGDNTLNLVSNAADDTDGTLSYSLVDALANWVDAQGCNEFVFLNEVLATGAVAADKLLVKGI